MLGLGVALVGLLAATSATAAQAQGAGQENKMTFEPSETMAAYLKRFEGKPVELRLVGSAEELSGRLAKVGQELVHLSELSGREFFDAVIRVDQVAAVVVQARGR